MEVTLYSYLRNFSFVVLSFSLALFACSDDDIPGADAGLADGAADVGSDGSTDGSTPKGPPVQTCKNSLAAPATGSCKVTKGSGSAVLYAGILLAPDKVYVNGHLLVSGGKITYVGCDASKATGYADATKVECPSDNSATTSIAPEQRTAEGNKYRQTDTDTRFVCIHRSHLYRKLFRTRISVSHKFLCAGI